MDRRDEAPAIRLESSGEDLVLAVGVRCRDRDWAAAFGDIQRALKVAQQGRLLLDLRSTEWIDPNPLLAIALELSLWRYRERAVTISLPDPISNPPRRARARGLPPLAAG